MRRTNINGPRPEEMAPPMTRESQATPGARTNRQSELIWIGSSQKYTCEVRPAKETRLSSQRSRGRTCEVIGLLHRYLFEIALWIQTRTLRMTLNRRVTVASLALTITFVSTTAQAGAQVRPGDVIIR